MRIFLVTNVLWLVLLGSCANGTVKTWIIGDLDLKHNQGHIHESMSFLSALGYRCYSPSDDEFWRNQLASAESCCNGGH